jgi:hypothetical protein
MLRFGLVAVAALLVTTLSWAAAAHGAQLSLSWVDASPDVLGFEVARSVGIAGPFTALATTGPGITTYVDATVADATIQCYRVRAFNAAGYSEYSVPACGRTPAPAIALAFDPNQFAFAPGDRFRAGATAVNAGPEAIVDLYFGSLLPPAAGTALGCSDGGAVAYLVDASGGLDGLVFGCLSDGHANALPLYRGVSVPAGSVTVDDFLQL